MRVDHRLFVTVGAALVLGAGHLLLQRVLPYPWANLANSSAIWALAAYGLGLWLGTRWWPAAIAGAVLLVLAVPVYYLTAAIFLHDQIGILWSSTAVLWMAFGVLAGSVFGAGATLVRSPGWRQLLGIALPGAVLFAEALVALLRDGDAGYRRDQLLTAIIEVVLGVLVIVLVGRTARQRLGGLAGSVPLALLGLVAFKAGGF